MADSRRTVMVRPLVTIEAAGIQTSGVAHVTRRRLVVEGARWNGINVDDGETIGTPKPGTSG